MALQEASWGQPSVDAIRILRSDQHYLPSMEKTSGAVVQRRHALGNECFPRKWLRVLCAIAASDAANFFEAGQDRRSSGISWRRYRRAIYRAAPSFFATMKDPPVQGHRQLLLYLPPPHAPARCARSRGAESPTPAQQPRSPLIRSPKYWPHPCPSPRVFLVTVIPETDFSGSRSSTKTS